MKDTIEILDKDTNTKQTYVLQEEQDQEQQIKVFYFELIKKIMKGALVCFKFVAYLVISFLELLIKVIKGMFFSDYKPFKVFTDSKASFMDNMAKDYVIKNTKPHAKTRHQYEFTRSELFARNYSKIDTMLKECAKNGITINEAIYKDILKRIDIIVVEAEREALQEGYSYAAFTKYRLSDDEVFDDFIEYKIMRGEGQHGKADKE